MIAASLRVRHRDKHDGRPYTVYRTIGSPIRFAATWDHDGADNVPVEADYQHETFWGAIQSLVDPNAAPRAASPAPVATPVAAAAVPVLQPELF